MFVGHGLVAFALAALAARRFGADSELALRIGVVAGLFAWVPDVDIAYAPAGLALRSVETVGPDVFWTTANVVHRGPTHSLVYGAALAIAAALWATRRRDGMGAAVLAGVALVAVAWFASGPLPGAVTAIFVVAGLAVATAAARLGFGPGTVLAAAAVGLLTHPFGDLFTGSPPPLLYPFDVTLVAERLVFHPDPTGHLLVAFVVELATVWLAAWTAARLRGVSLSDLIAPRAAVGAGYAVAVVFLPAPTLSQSSQFVFSVLAMATVGAPMRPFSRGFDPAGTAATGLAAVTAAVVAYALAYGVL